MTEKHILIIRDRTSIYYPPLYQYQCICHKYLLTQFNLI